MNSVQQTILGLVLVGIAFIFGSYLHRDNDPQVADNQIPGTENLQWQEGSSEQKNFQAQDKPSNQAMPNLNSAQSSMPKLVEANLVPDLSKTPASPSRSLEVVEPDFSRFAISESNAVNSNSQLVETSAKSTTQPNFESHFPQPITGTVENIQPRMPKRDLAIDAQQSPAGVEVTQKQLSLNNSRNLSSVLENSEAAVQPQSIQNNHYRRIRTETIVTSIRPRTNSPIMMDTQEYKSHETAAGDTLQDLAVKYFGDPAYYLDIYVANKDVLRTPGDLPTGVTLRIPVY